MSSPLYLFCSGGVEESIVSGDDSIYEEDRRNFIANTTTFKNTLFKSMKILSDIKISENKMKKF